MNRRLIKSLMTAACAAAPLALMPSLPAAAQAVQRPANDIVLSIGRGQLVTTAGSMADVFVANQEVADVQVKSNRQLYVFGKAGGETTVYASNSAGDVIWSANVRVGSNIDSVDQMLGMAMPDAKVVVSTMGTNTFLLTGTVASPEDAAEAQRLVSAFVGKEANVISRLRMATPLQVNLQVKFAEVSRSLLKSLQVNLSTIDSTSGFQFGIGQGREGFAPTVYTGPNQALGIGNKLKIPVPDMNNQQKFIFNPLTGGFIPDPNNPQKFIEGNGTSVDPIKVGSTLAGVGRLFGVNILGALDAGETVGLVTTLAQPNLTALSGETADFLAGGEYPIPISQGLGSTSIEYKKYGVSLAYTPIVLANGRISLRVRPEVSELSTQGAVVLNGFQVPALTIRRAETTIELGSGQSFMIAGLLANNSQNTIQKLPGAGDLPILGSLFRSTSYRKGETELVIVVTPYLVNPVDARDIKLPTDGFSAPNDLQRILGNMESSSKSGQQRPVPSAAPSAGAMRPAIGALEMPAAPAGSRKRRGASTRAAAAQTTPTPGFSIN